MKRYYTSESVGAGHPDKICDQISDAILDELLKQDKNSRVACDVIANDDVIYIGGQITTKGYVDTIKIAWDILKPLGYKLGAGDQGLLFGYATDENEFFMPWPLVLSHELVKRAEYLRKKELFPYAKADMKSQVTMEYDNINNEIKISKILMSIQHEASFNDKEFKEYIIQNIIKYVTNKYKFNDDYEILINPTGRFVIGGPKGDTGLTGRKIIVDTYGGFARHGGGAFSGKDATKIDRSAAYMARYVAKNIVASKIAKKCEIQLSYAIGLPNPQSIYVDTFNTSKYSEEELIKMIYALFDLSVEGIINTLDLLKPIYLPLATYGHFGRIDLNLPWEKTDMTDKIKNYFKK